MTKRERDNYTYGFIAVASVLFLAWIIPAQTPPYPGYGVPSDVMPNVAVGMMLALSLLGLLRNVLEYQRDKKKGQLASSPLVNPDNKVHLLNLVRFLVPCVLLMPAMRWLGFIPVGLVFMLLLQYYCGQRKPVTMALVAVCTIGAMYAIMRYGLSVPMP